MASPENNLMNENDPRANAESFGLRELPQERAKMIISIAKILCDEFRIRLLDALRTEGPMAVHELNARLGHVPQPTISKALLKMQEAGWVHSQKEGREHIYGLTPGGRNLFELFIQKMQKPDTPVSMLHIPLDISPPAGLQPGI